MDRQAERQLDRQTDNQKDKYKYFKPEPINVFFLYHLLIDRQTDETTDRQALTSLNITD